MSCKATIYVSPEFQKIADSHKRLGTEPFSIYPRITRAYQHVTKQDHHIVPDFHHCLTMKEEWWAFSAATNHQLF